VNKKPFHSPLIIESEDEILLPFRQNVLKTGYSIFIPSADPGIDQLLQPAFSPVVFTEYTRFFPVVFPHPLVPPFGVIPGFRFHLYSPGSLMLSRMVTAPALNADQLVVGIAVHIPADTARTRYPVASFPHMKDRVSYSICSVTRLCLYFCSHLILHPLINNICAISPTGSAVWR
jgi:hypothetical protein